MDLVCMLALLVFFFFFFLILLLHHRPGPPMNWPLVGMLPGIISNLHRIHEWYTELLAKYQCNFVLKGPWLLAGDVLLTADPANVNHVFNLGHKNYPRTKEVIEVQEVLGDGIFNSELHSWSYQRRKAHAHLTSPAFQSFSYEVSERNVEGKLFPFLSQMASSGVVFDLQDVFLRLTFDITVNLILDVDLNCLSPELPTVLFSQAVDTGQETVLFRYSVPRFLWKLMRWLRIGVEKRYAMAKPVVEKFLAERVAEEKKKKEETPAGRDTAAVHMLTSYVSTETDTFLRDTTLNFLLAGRDTTAACLTWFFWMISKNPTVEEKILAELQQIISRNEKREQPFPTPILLEGEDLDKTVYLHAALNETLRLFPPVPVIYKHPMAPDVLPSGHYVRPGMTIVTSLYAMARMKVAWGEDCLQFKPERWITEEGQLRYVPSYKFFTFGSGRRNCLGKATAFRLMKAVAANLIYNFRVEVAEDRCRRAADAAKPKFSLVLHMENGLKVKVRKRSRIGF